MTSKQLENTIEELKSELGNIHREVKSKRSRSNENTKKKYIKRRGSKIESKTQLLKEKKRWQTTSNQVNKLGVFPHGFYE